MPAALLACGELVVRNVEQARDCWCGECMITVETLPPRYFVEHLFTAFLVSVKLLQDANMYTVVLAN